MKTKVEKPSSNRAAATIEDALVVSTEVEPMAEDRHKPFIEANTTAITLDHLKRDCTIPVFSKDNECTIAHQEFIEVVQECAQAHFPEQTLSLPDIRVSHEVKGRIPEAIGKPAKELLEHEKTMYFERMAFIIELPGFKDTIQGNELCLTIGGVRAYNHENLYSRKSLEKFKVFIGFKNSVCTNLCISTDGYAEELRVADLNELKNKVLSLLRGYQHEEHLKLMNTLSNYELTEHQFAQLIGKMRLYQYLLYAQKKMLPVLEFNDGQINTVAKDYYQSNFCRNADGSIDLWKCYNLFTSASKSSYIDTFLDRNVNAYTICNGLVKAVQGEQRYAWFLN